MPSAERAGQGPETAGISPVPLNKGWTERPHLGWYRGLEERGTQASEPRTLSCRHPAPPTFCAGSRPALQPHNDTSPTTTPAQRQRSQAAPRCQARECQGGPPSPGPGAHGQVPCGLPPCGARVGPRTSVCSESVS